MMPIGPATRIYLAAGATDLRKGFEGLSDLVQHRFQQDPLSGHLFVFANRRATRIKLLYWDGTGTWICAKRLDRGTYGWPQGEGPSRLLRAEELSLLIQTKNLSLCLAV